MANDVSRVYQFLAKQGNWELKADKNGDGTIIKSEFHDFMEENFEWNGEDTSAKNDLINSFWKSIDTNQSGKIKGTKLTNRNALDSKEMANIEGRIAIYEALDEYLKNLQIPNEVGDKLKWKKSVAESLGNYTEMFIKQGGKLEGLTNYLDSIRMHVENKTTADICAQDYINQAMSNVIREYGYKYETDTLASIVDAFVQNLPEDATPSTIQQTVQNIVDAYMATAGLNDGDVSMLAEYGYSANDNSPLNGLQKTIVEKNMRTALEAIKNEPDYEANKELYADAVNQFIEKTLNAGKYGDFEALKAYGVNEFKQDETGKGVAQAITLQGLFEGDELYNSVAQNISSSLAEKIKTDGKYLTVIKEIKADVLEKLKNGEFKKADGSLDTQKALDYILGQIQSRINEFYPNGLSNMSLRELNNIYDNLIAGAEKEPDGEKSLARIRDAAIQYCKAVAAKSTVFAEKVKEAFNGENYATAINKMLGSDIKETMEVLKAELEALGDIDEMSDSEKAALFANVKDSYSAELGQSYTFDLPRSAKLGDTTIGSERIQYSISGSGLSVDASGKVTVDANKAGVYTPTIIITIDGKKFSKQVKVEIIETPEMKIKNVIDKTTDEKMALADNIDNWNTDANFLDLYNNDKNVILFGEMDTNNRDWDHMKASIKSDLAKLGSDVVSILAKAGLEKSKLETAADTVVNRYIDQGAIRNKNNKGTKRSSIINNCNSYMADHRESTASRIVWTVDTTGKDSNVYMIHFKDFVDDILKEYFNS